MVKRRKIFISYRREDEASGYALLVCNALALKFGSENVVIDVDLVQPGQRFDYALEKALSESDVLIAVIGPRWMELLSERIRSGKPDIMREEIASGLAQKIDLIPLLIGREARMPVLPDPSDLPENIRALAWCHKHTIAHERFKGDVAALISAVKLLRHRSKPWRAITISSVLGIILIAALLGYWTDNIPRIWFNKILFSSNSEAIMPTRAEEQAKRAGITDCDRLAASPFDASRPSGVAGVNLAEMSGVKATVACDAAIRDYPEVTRFVYQAGRAAYARKDFALAAAHYRSASTNGNALALANLGVMFESGQGVPQDFAEAHKLYEKATRLGNVISMYNLGALYENGRGVAKDLDEARRWYKVAADAGDEEAKERLKNLK